MAVYDQKQATRDAASSAKVRLQQVGAELEIRRILGASLEKGLGATCLAVSAPRGLRRLRQNLLDVQGCQMLSGPNVKLPGLADGCHKKGDSRAFVVASSGLYSL